MSPDIHLSVCLYASQKLLNLEASAFLLFLRSAAWRTWGQRVLKGSIWALKVKYMWVVNRTVLINYFFLPEDFSLAALCKRYLGFSSFLCSCNHLLLQLNGLYLSQHMHESINTSKDLNLAKSVGICLSPLWVSKWHGCTRDARLSLNVTMSRKKAYRFQSSSHVCKPLSQFMDGLANSPSTLLKRRIQNVWGAGYECFPWHMVLFIYPDWMPQAFEIWKQRTSMRHLWYLLNLLTFFRSSFEQGTA